jgi:hypothetical protein
VTLLLGVNAFAAQGEAARRQAAALASWRDLAGVRLVNLGWPGDVYEVEGFATHPLLSADARSASGRAGPRKPLVPEMFDRLARLAADAGCRWFAYANADVHWTQAAVDRVAAEALGAYALSRMDVDEGGRALGMVTSGVDAFVVSVERWATLRRRCRAYIGGEPIWDNVYAAVLLRHAGALLLNRDALITHQRHPASDWRQSPYAGYLNYLAGLDRAHFSRWATYHHRLGALRAAGAPEADELRLQREVFTRREGALAGALQAARALKTRVRWAVQRGRAA